MTRQLMLSSYLYCHLALASAAVTHRMDERLQTLVYQPNTVVDIHASQLFQTAVEMGHDETIVDIEIGDKSAWLTSFNVQLPYIFFIKPTLDRSDTNLTVMTDKHLYHFQLMVDPSHQKPIYHIKFIYPKRHHSPSAHQHPKANVMPDYWYWEYTYRGNGSVVPTRIFDNGTQTFLEFDQHARLPAVYQLDDSGHESLVNIRRQGRYLVLNDLFKQLTFRLGRRLAIVTRVEH